MNILQKLNNLTNWLCNMDIMEDLLKIQVSILYTRVILINMLMFKKFLSSDSSTSKDIKMMYYYLSECENSTDYYILYRFLKISLNFCVSFPLILTWNLLKGVEFYCVRNFQNLKKYTKILVKKANIRSKILWKLIEKNVLKNNYIPKIKIYSPLIMNFL